MMKEKTQFSLTIPDLEFFNPIAFVATDLMIDVRLSHDLEPTSECDFHVFGPHLFLMGRLRSSEDRKSISRKGRHLKAKLPCNHVWTEGMYVLLMRHRPSGTVLCVDFMIDNGLQCHVMDTQSCPPFSDESLLCDDELLNRHMWEWFGAVPGLEQLRRETVRQLRIRRINEKRQDWKLAPMGFCRHYLITAPTTDYLRRSLMLFKHIALPDDELETVACDELYDPMANVPYEELNNKFKQKPSGDLFELLSHAANDKSKFYSFINIGALLRAGGKQIMKTIIPHMRPEMTGVFITGTQQEIDELLGQYPSLHDIFPDELRLSILPYSRFELVQTMNWRINAAHLFFTPEALNKLMHILTQAYDQGSIRHWTLTDMDRYLQRQVMPNLCQRQAQALNNGETDRSMGWVCCEDIDALRLTQQTSTYEEALQELSQMAGLTDIKQRITTMANRIKLYAERRRLGLKTDANLVSHAIFTGNPGTGKTTVARLLGRIYHSLGLLSRGNVITVDRAKIVGRFIGDTEANMMQLLEEARGNVLFIDEAYTLYSGKSENDFGRRAIECLLTVLTQKNPDMLVVLAGYEKEMDMLMSMNPGLVGRFPFKVRFDDYRPEELMQIADTLLAKEEYVLTMEARNQMYANISSMVGLHAAHFSNARWVEQYVRDGIIPAMADRLAAAHQPLCRDDYRRIEAQDVIAANRLFSAKSLELKPRRAVGF